MPKNFVFLSSCVFTFKSETTYFYVFNFVFMFFLIFFKLINKFFF